MVTSADDAGPAVVEALAAKGAGATGIDLSFGPDELAVAAGRMIADRIVEQTELDVFIRTDLPMAAGVHNTIRTAGRRPQARPGLGTMGRTDVADIQLDHLGAGPASDAVASGWPDETDQPFMISTLGFGELSDAELMALATVATVRDVAAITTDRPGIVRRVVDTVTAVLAADRDV